MPVQERIEHLPDEAATRLLAADLAEELEPGDLIALDGPLGAGKTTFVQGLARGLGIPEDVRVNSPTYAYVNEYRQGRLPLIHMDLYRVDTLDDLEAIGYRELYESDGVCAVEWAERVPEALPPRRIEIRIDPEDGERRTITIRRVRP